jgi:prophage regulatory protein
MDLILLKLPEVLRTRARSRSSHYRDIEQGLFTNPVTIGHRAVAWPAHEVTAVNEARLAGKSEAAIKQLVIQLEAARTNGEAIS